MQLGRKGENEEGESYNRRESIYRLVNALSKYKGIQQREKRKIHSRADR